MTKQKIDQEVLTEAQASAAKQAVVDVLRRLQDAVDKRLGAQIDESLSPRAADRIERIALRTYDDIEHVIDLLESYELDVFPAKPAGGK